MWVDGQLHAAVALPPGKRPRTHLQEAGWAPGPVWTAAKNLTLTGIRSPEHPASRYTDCAIPTHKLTR
jgi:hypothetical protein